MNLRVEKATPENVPQIVALIKEFAEFEKLSHACEITESDLREAVFGTDAFVQILIAVADETMVGYAIFYPIFKSFRGERGIFLEDLYVSPAMRGRGLGLKMLREVARKAKLQGFRRMDWQALKWNKQAIGFYESLSSDYDDENFDFCLRGSAFKTLAERRS